MKKILCALLAVAMMLSMVACATPNKPTKPETAQNTDAIEKTEPADTTPEAQAPVEDPVPSDSIPADTTGPVETTEPIEGTEAVEATEVVMESYKVYVPNDNANGFVVEVIEVEQITLDSVIDELKKHNILTGAVSVNQFEVVDNQLNIDFNQAFSDLVCSMGTSGEMMTVGSVVNTLIDALQVESVFFTVNNQILESGHVIYDCPNTFIEIGND